MIFAIKPFEIHDGDGIRTTLFFKGCPLRCKWCHNPESFESKKQMLYNADRCIGCMKCTEICKANVTKDNKHIFNRSDCTLCGECEKVCDAKAFEISGMDISAETLAKQLLKDELFMKGSGGGVTFSGGEPLLQAEFCVEVAKILKQHDINIAIDTCGYVNRSEIEKIMPYADTFLFDIKAIDSDVHKRCTGKDNKIILENLLYIDGCGKNIQIRYPYVPDFNDGEAEKISEFVKKLKNVTKVEVLPYHNYAKSKYTSLGMENTLPEKLSDKSEIQKVQSLFEK